MYIDALIIEWLKKKKKESNILLVVLSDARLFFHPNLKNNLMIDFLSL